MSLRSAWIILLFLLLGPIGVTVADSPEPGPVLVLGDSLSADYGMPREAGWVALVEDRMRAQDDRRGVINASISGDTTRSARARLPDLLEDFEPSVLILQLGGNDGLRGLPLEEMSANLAALIEAGQQSGARVILAGVRLPPNYGPQYARRFEQTYEDLAEAHDLVLIPRLLEGVDDRDELMSEDGIHPSASAQPVIADQVWSRLEPLLEATRSSAGRSPDAFGVYAKALHNTRQNSNAP